jgi:hypothetical protein
VQPGQSKSTQRRKLRIVIELLTPSLRSKAAIAPALTPAIAARLRGRATTGTLRAGTDLAGAENFSGPLFPSSLDR